MKASLRKERLFLLALAIAAAAIIVVCTHWGLATSSDSARYVRTARHILGTEPIIDTGEPAHEQAHYPPGYPFALAAAAVLTHSDPLAAARWLHVLLFAANVVLVALLAKRHAGGRTNAGGQLDAGERTDAGGRLDAGGRIDVAVIAAAVLALLAPASIFVHAWLLSESLFVTFSLIAMLLLTAHLERPRMSLLIATAIVASLGMMARYAGAAALPAAVAAILLLDRRECRQRVADAAIFTGVFVVLPIAWMIRNHLAGGSATNRDIAFHPISLEHIKEGIATLAIWLTPFNVAQPRVDANGHPLVASIAFLLFIAVLGSGIAVAVRRREKLAGVCALYIVSFLLLLAFSISFVDFHTPADTRVLSPIFFAWAVLAASLIKPGWRVAVAAIVLLVLVWPSIQLVSRLWREGDGFAHAQWQNSPTISAVKQLPADKQIFTNAPGAVYLLTGRQLVLTVPAETSSSSMLPNPDYPQLMARIESDLHAGRGVVVYLRRYGARRANYPSEEQLKRKLALHPLARFNDGSIFDYVGPATTAATTAPTPQTAN